MVALKRPKPEVMALPDFTKRFLREARTASRLLHPNITTVFAAYEQDGVPWLVMELVEGSSLRDRLARSGPLPIGEIIAHAEGLPMPCAPPTSRGSSTPTSTPTTF